jgi:exopolysaccharide biosynthesis protein
LLWITPFFAQESLKGIVYSQIYDEHHQVPIHVLEVDPKLFDIISVRAEDKNGETVPSMAKRHQAVAAINGGFFQPLGKWMKLPLGILKIAHEWHSTSYKPRGAIGWSNSNQVVLFDQVQTATNVQIDNQAFLIDGINRLPREDLTILYNSLFYHQLPKKKMGHQFLIQNYQISELTYPYPLTSANSYILFVGSTKILPFQPVKKYHCFSYAIQVLPQTSYTTTQEWRQVEYIVGGMPILIRNKQILTDFSLEEPADTFLYNCHPRTAVGLLTNGHWLFIVVDGRLPNIGLGISIPVLARLMQELGCVEALNLDGGGCSMMVLNDQVVNQPCGYEEDAMGDKIPKRTISDAILIIPKHLQHSINK